MKKLTPVLALAIAAALTACGGGSDEEPTAVDKMVEGAKDMTNKAVETTKEAAGDVVEGAKDAATSAMEGTGNVVDKAKDATAGAVNAVKEGASSAVEGAKDMAASAVDTTKDMAAGAVDKAKDVGAATAAATAGAVTATKDVAAGAVDKAKDAGATAKSAVVAAAPTVDAKALYGTCAGCHGQNGETKALGVSPVIAGQSAADIEKKLHGYKDGSYGGSMASVMKGQVGSLSDADITALAGMISKF